MHIQEENQFDDEGLIGKTRWNFFYCQWNGTNECKADRNQSGYSRRFDVHRNTTVSP